LVFKKEIPGRKAKYKPFDGILPAELSKKMGEMGVSLYSHQRDALNALKERKNICVSTSTSSGKTLIYALQIASNYYKKPKSTALLIYPTKALSRDQLSQLNNLYERLGLNIAVGVYDGDASPDEKMRIRENANVTITNFQGLNLYLSAHNKWARFMNNLDLVVIDEAHSYSGIQGIHVAWIIRRLERIATRYKSNPQFILTSATIGNPKNHSENLIGKKIEVIDSDGSPHGKREIVFWNPPLLDAKLNIRKSTHRESSGLLANLTHNNLQTLMFAVSRKLTELDAKWTKEVLREKYNDAKVQVKPYNAGHRKEERHIVEGELKQGDINGVVSTNALELGIDIGFLDATILSGYPGSRVSFWQQVGRSGRGGKETTSIMVAFGGPLDQYIIRHPAYLLEDSIENAVVDLSNNIIYSKHLLCAAYEIPLTFDDIEYFGERLIQATQMYLKSGMFSGGIKAGVRFNGDGQPQQAIDIYSTGQNQFDVYIEDRGKLISLPSIEKERAYRDFHPDAIYLHQGEYHKVETFDEGKDPHIILKPIDVDYYTEALKSITIKELAKKGDKTIGKFGLGWGMGDVNLYYWVYNKKSIVDDTVLGSEPTGLDPFDIHTQVCWLEIPDKIKQKIIEKYGDDGFLGGIHAVEHALISMTPLLFMLDKRDIGGLSVGLHNETEKATIFTYDGIEGGVGFSQSIYQRFDELAEKTLELIETCPCKGDGGCPSCIMDPQCGNNNTPLHKNAAITLLKLLLDM
jgi:DEAD/DEAH box helicase domain-containing protein